MCDAANQESHESLATRFVLPIVLCALAVGCYANSLNGPFIFDDHGNIVGNPAIGSLWPRPEESRLASRRPIGHLSLALNYRFARMWTGDGLDVRSYHLLNMVIHTITGLLLFGVVRRTLQLETLRPRYGPLAAYLAFAMAAIWIVHPLQTSGVTYVIQRLESLMAMFYMLCLYGILRGAQSASLWRMVGWYVTAVAAFWAGLGTKEVMATAVAVVPLYDRIFLSDSWRTVVRRRGAVYLGFVPALIWFAIVLAPALSPDSGLTTGFGVRSVTPWEYLRSQPGVLLHYLRLAFWPHPLCLDYGWPVARTPSEIVMPGLVIVGLLVISLLALVRWPRIGFLGISFFLILSPTSSFVPIKELAFEYRMYLPLAPLTVLVVLGVYHGCERVLARTIRPARAGKRRAAQLEQRRVMLGRLVPATVLVLSLTILASLTRDRNRDYETEMAIWADTVRKRPNNTRAHINLGNVYLGKGDFDAAIQCYTHAIEIKPDDATAYNNRGRVYSERKKYRLALHDFDKAIAIDPKQVRAYHNRGIVHMELEDYEKAIADVDKALELDPKKADSYYVRGTCYLQLNQLDRALADLTTALELQPDSPEALMNRGSAYFKQRRYAQALADLTSAVELQANLGAAYVNRALCYLFLRRYDEAWRDVRTAQRLGETVPPQLLQGLRAATGLHR